MSRFTKNRKDDLYQIDQLSIRFETKVSNEFMAQVNKLKSDKAIEQIRTYLEEGRPELAQQYLDDQDNNSPWFLLFFQIYVAAAILQTSIIASSVLSIQNGYYGVPIHSLSFDPTDPKNAVSVQLITTLIIKGLADSRKLSIQYLIAQGYTEGLTPAQIAENIRKYAGLTTNQIDAVKNYRTLLEAGSKEALNRSLRDKRFDPSVGKPLSKEQVDKMVDAYTKRMLDYRAKVIGRTKTGDIVNAAIQDASKAAADATGINEQSLVKEWRSMRDKKVRFTHSNHGGMDGQVVGINEKFQSPSGAQLLHPHDGNAPIAETANCRCRLLVYVKPENR